MSFLPPILLHYYITLRCNCSCLFCDIWKLAATKNDDARLDDILKNVQEARALGVRFVDFTGGEPLLHADLPAMLRYAKNLGYKTSVTSNCLLYVQESKRLQGLIDFLHFSLDGLSADKHDGIRGQSSFKDVMDSLDVARQLGEKPDLLFTVGPHNIDHLQPMSEFARALGLMLVVNPIFSYSAVLPPEVNFLDTIDRLALSPFVYINPAFHRLRRFGGNQKNAPRCRVMDSTIVISPDNRLVLPCYHFQQEAVSITENLEHLPCAETDKILKKSVNQSMTLPSALVGNSPVRTSVRNTLSTPESISLSPRIQNNLKFIRRFSTWRHYYKNQGRFDFCQGCHLNCYFDPSFFYKVDAYFWQSAHAKWRYWWSKNIRRTIEQKRFDARPAREIAAEIMSTYANH